MPLLEWLGRDKATTADKAVPLKILREEASLGYGVQGVTTASSPSDLPHGVLVHGDNLEALKALLPFYAGEVKCIYIDPPYNTGSAFEHYDDNLEHATWLNLMYPRLKLLREFLREDGSIWISIDDREGAYLQVICDEVFGRKNYVANISWQRNYSVKGDSKGIVTSAEHILVYSKRDDWLPKKMPRSFEMDKKYKNPDNDPKGLWRPDNSYASEAITHQGMVYAIQHPFTGELLYPTTSSHWRYGQDEMLAIMNGWCPYELKEIDDAEKRAAICGVSVKEVRKGVKAIMLAQSVDESQKKALTVLKQGQWPRFYFGSNGKGKIARKTYLDSVGGIAPQNLWLHQEVGHTDEAKKEVLKLFDGQSPFATPKPERLIKRILEIATNEGDLVLDSFLGSGTTAAVAHKMGRRWIGIEMGEHARTHCAVRMKKVIDGEQGGISKAVKWQGGGAFRYYELGEPLLDANGQIAATIPYDVLAAHIWWQETGTAWNENSGATGTVLGLYNGTAYALLYNGILHDRSVAGGNVLTRQTLAVIKEDLHCAKYRRLVIYAEWCRLGDERLATEGIEFRQIPYDVVVRR
ncbi:MAG: site-specific DNA-methyltransferase [Victivallales bacterium]|nr:site-specific DNA-methyltransferase [Victivallales bacterium]